MVPLLAASALAWLHGGVVVRCADAPAQLVQVDPATGASARLPIAESGWVQWSPDGRLVAAVEPVDLQVNRIRVLDADGTALATAFGGEPAWSRDGRLAYAVTFPFAESGAPLFVLDTPGSTPRQIATGSWPTWSPDGTQLAVMDGGISVVDVETGAKRRVAIGGMPAWSPRGDWIAYATTGGVAVVRPDGTHPHRLTRISDDEALLSWSPDGTRLAVLFHFRSGRSRLAVVPLVGRTRFASLADGLSGVPLWSPDGRSIAVDNGNEIRLVDSTTLRSRALASPC